MKAKQVLGKTRLDPIGQVLQTGYYRFDSPTGIDGLVKHVPYRLDVLAVNAKSPGTGQFREFIDRAKKVWPAICIWHVGNAELASALVRYGFAPEVEVDGTGEVMEGFRWDRNKVNQTKKAHSTK